MEQSTAINIFGQFHKLYLHKVRITHFYNRVIPRRMSYRVVDAYIYMKYGPSQRQGMFVCLACTHSDGTVAPTDLFEPLDILPNIHYFLLDVLTTGCVRGSARVILYCMSLGNI